MPTHPDSCQCQNCETERSERAIAAIKALHQSGGRKLSDQETVEFICQPIKLGIPPSTHKKKAGRPSKRTPLVNVYHRAYLLRRNLFHPMVRLENNRPKAASTRKRAGNPSREIVFKLAQEAKSAGCPRRLMRRQIKSLAAARGLTIPGDWQLGKLINEFLKVDTTT